MTKKYKCDYMDSGINFERNGIYVCCKTAHKGKGWLLLSDSYENLDWDKIFELKKNWQKQIASGNPPEKCIGCSEIVETDELVEDMSLYYVDVNSFCTCNSKCLYCDCWHFDSFKETSLYPAFLKLFEKKLLKHDKYGYIQFAGGEPALMIDFEKIVDLCIQNGIERYIVNSNGIKYSKGIEKLLINTKTNLCVSLDSGCAETYEKIKNVPCFDKVINNLKKYINTQNKDKSCIWSKYIIIPGVNDNEEELKKWFNLSLNIGIRSIALDIEREWFKNHNRQILPEHENMINIIQIACRENNIKFEFYESLKCFYGIR